MLVRYKPIPITVYISKKNKEYKILHKKTE